jgi:nitrite reductase/ring-hydroxylating ferredoxin subunit
MPTPLTRDPALNVAASYRRCIAASLERVWENVLDWEHLPWLHRDAFGSIALHEAGDWGWRARTTARRSGKVSEIELLVDLVAGHYVSRVTEGEGEGQEIWTTLYEKSARETEIVIDFCTPVADEGVQGLIGKSYLRLYAGLWDEDEAMMRARQEALDRQGSEACRSMAVVELGLRSDLLARVPLAVEFAGRPFRLIELEGALVAHAAVCPHMLGPLDGAACENGVLTCPWHGHAFDVRTGRSHDGRDLHLDPAPRVEVDPASDVVRLVAAEPVTA